MTTNEPETVDALVVECNDGSVYVIPDDVLARCRVDSDGLPSEGLLGEVSSAQDEVSGFAIDNPVLIGDQGSPMTRPDLTPTKVGIVPVDVRMVHIVRPVW